MANINYPIQEMAQLALGVIFIISISAANCLLVISLLRQRRAIYAVRSAVLLSLVAGDLVLALFALVVDLIGQNNFQCNAPFFSRVYRDYMLQFVYSVGLLMLSLYLMMAYKGYQQRQEQQQQQQEQQQLMRSFNGVDTAVTGGGLQSSGYGMGTRLEDGGSKASRLGLALICSGVPWLVALIVILPLAAPRLSECYVHINLTQEMIYLWACVILPGSLALLVAGGTAAVLNPRQQHYPAATADYTPGAESGEEAVPLQTSIDPGAHRDAAVACGRDFPGTRNDTGHPNSAAESSPARTLYPDPTFYPPQTTETMAAYGGAAATSASGPLALDQHNTLNFKREKSALLAVAVVHFVCVLPNALFTLTFAANPELHNDIDNVMFAVLSELCKWVAVLRSVLAPLCWIAFLRG